MPEQGAATYGELTVIPDGDFCKLLVICGGRRGAWGVRQRVQPGRDPDDKQT